MIFKTSTLLLFSMLFVSYNGSSQSNTMMGSINASGYEATGNAGTVSYSIGQVFYSYLEDPFNNQVAQGIQHAVQQNEDLPEDTDTSTEVEAPEINVLIYPNPATDFVTLATKGISFQNQVNSYQLFNYQGQLIMQNTMHQDHTTININNLSTSIYILRVYVNNKLYNTFKILKK